MWDLSDELVERRNFRCGERPSKARIVQLIVSCSVGEVTRQTPVLGSVPRRTRGVELYQEEPSGLTIATLKVKIFDR
jgi:hypothetical protein